ncbi:DUF305 domain-containing protein [Brevundimonas sp.]|uniref:DUF305 domain-containing protein n=1 Tax=Brevundimonas sp. TaxID=1871086 RepID=UPI00286AECFA|nr:DUF305 domain-containing protein [Brevundimonas sp.]
MRLEFGIVAALMSGLIAGQAFAQTPSAQTPPAGSPPIFQPGAPGQPSRIVTPEEAMALGRTTFTEADVGFMQHMIVHHAQAVEMVALLDTRGSDRRVKLLGRRIALSQEAEIALMRGWLQERGRPVEMPGMDHSAMGHGAHAGMNHGAMSPGVGPDDTPVMAGMLTPRQMRTLAAASGTDFDRLFLAGMIQHHQGAIDMVGALMETPDAAQDTLLSDFTNAVVADQSTEILRMQSLSAEL